MESTKKRAEEIEVGEVVFDGGETWEVGAIDTLPDGHLCFFDTEDNTVIHGPSDEIEVVTE
jgi:hypothetical protein